MRNKQYSYEELQAALDATSVSPKEGWERMIRNGIINRDGKVTRLIGGEAEPEPGALMERAFRIEECKTADRKIGDRKMRSNSWIPERLGP
jgi:hypothetical protein